jgi:hypothetical protein
MSMTINTFLIVSVTSAIALFVDAAIRVEHSVLCDLLVLILCKAS